MKSFICLWFVLSFMDLCLCGDPVNITAKPGQDVTLTCGAAGNGKVSVVRLIRGDLEPDSVLLYRDDQIDEEQQNPQYKGRTNLKNLISTDGKVNLTLNSVTKKDSGTYECRVKTETKSNRRRKRDTLERTTIILSVAAAKSDLPGRGHSGLVAVSVIGALVILVILAAVSVLKNPQNVDISRTFHWPSLFSHGNPAIRKPMRTFRPDAGPKPGQMERVV